jgi:hypothetical protein
METVRLRRIQEPSRAQRLLEAYIARAEIVPEGAYQIRDPNELPHSVQAIVSRENAQGHVWSVWAQGVHIWLFTGEMSLPLSRERGTPVLIVCLHNQDGEIMESGTWRYDPLGMWSRCAD